LSEIHARSLANQVAGRHPVQFLVDERQDAIEGFGIAVTPRAEQVRHLATVAFISWPAHGENRAKFSRAKHVASPPQRDVYGARVFIHEGAERLEILQLQVSAACTP
jgi:hypothetical protein